MSVYVVEAWGSDRAGWVWGVFSSEDAAKAALLADGFVEDRWGTWRGGNSAPRAEIEAYTLDKRD